MAFKTKTAMAVLFVSAIVFAEVAQAFESNKFVIHAQHQGRHGRHSGLKLQECGGACQYRCSKTQYRHECLFFCNKCCAKCRCVPPGTYGHKEVCPCYNNWKTKEGGPKCP